jgi:TonB-linked SusC/RagA family outer membrane protein
MSQTVCQLLRATLVAALIPWHLGAQQPDAGTGTITGRIVELSSQRPLSDVQVRVLGTQRGAVTNDRGEYRINAITAGTVQLRAQRIGYAPVTQSVTVAAGASATSNFVLSATAIQIDEVVVTATGESQRKRESGNTIATVTPTQEQLATTTNIAEVLQASAPGVYVNSPGGTQGSANRIRVRGASSLSLSNEPLLIVDGVRASNEINGTGSIGVGGQTTSRLNDINPDDIETIEVIKGPAASALYGTAGANGVIQIRTKRGRAGKAKWNAFFGAGQQKDVQSYPANYTWVGTNTAGARVTGCTLDAQSRKVCTPKPDSLVSFNPLEQYSPYITGKTGSIGASVAGGGDVASYFVSADVDDDNGIFEPNQFRRWSTRVNVTGQFKDNISAQISTAYTGSRLEFPQNDNNTLGILGGGLLGSAFDDPVGHGFITGQTVQDLYAIDVRENVERFIGSAPVVWQVNKWLTANATAGVDFFDRRNRQTIPPGKVNFGSLPEGQRNANNADIWNYTTNGSLTAAFDITPTLRSTTTGGVQFTREYVEGVRAQGAKLLGGTGSLQGASARFVVGETNTDNRTYGGLVSEQLAWRDRLFLTAALRTDRNSAFGKDFGFVTYPAASLSYVISDEGFFPKNDILNSLRLRTAYGESGKQPNFRDAITYFNTQTVTIAGSDQPGITVGGTGNADLKPEVSREFEGGFEASLLNSRVGLEVTYYKKTSNDLLIARPLPPSLGLTTTQFDNLGQSQNQGLEIMLRGQVVNLRNVKFDLTATYAGNKTKLTDIGRLPTGDKIPPIVFGIQRHAEGYPLGGYWDESIKYADKNGDGIITRVNCPGQTQVAGGPQCEMEIGSLSYLGQPLPTREISVTPRLQLFDWLQFTALIDHKGGFVVFNNTARFRCNFGNCQAAYDKTASFADQAANLGQLMNTDAGYVEDGTFTKLREVAATLTAPRAWANRLRTESLTLTLAARNVAKWTDYKGFDPEVNSQPGSNFGTSDFLTQPPLRIMTARLAIGF